MHIYWCCQSFWRRADRKAPVIWLCVCLYWESIPGTQGFCDGFCLLVLLAISVHQAMTPSLFLALYRMSLCMKDSPAGVDLSFPSLSTVKTWCPSRQASLRGARQCPVCPPAHAAKLWCSSTPKAVVRGWCEVKEKENERERLLHFCTRCYLNILSAKRFCIETCLHHDKHKPHPGIKTTSRGQTTERSSCLETSISTVSKQLCWVFFFNGS